MRCRRWSAIMAAVVVLAGGTASAMFAFRPEAPVTRLLENIERRLQATPDDPHLLYLAGRTHALAYAQGEEAVAKTTRGTPEQEIDRLPEFREFVDERLKFEGKIDEERIGHLRAGIRLLRRAAELAPAPEDESARDDRPLLHLGLGWLLDDGSRFAPRLGHPLDQPPDAGVTEPERNRLDASIRRLGAEEEAEREEAFGALRKEFDVAWSRLVAQRDAEDDRVRAGVARLLKRWWQDQALTSYRAAYALSKAGDAKDEYEMSGTFTISREAGEAILRLGDGAVSDGERKDIKAHLRKLDGRGYAVTPVVFPESGPVPLADLLPPGRTARFDLAGDGVPRLWPWPSSDAAFLVWLPAPDAEVTSGRRLFGARTWWIFWRDGYEPLSMLDDDGDGRLSGAELDGIGVWRDLDGDGASQPHELCSAAAFGIRWITVEATRTEDGVPAAELGIGLSDGSTRPTYDWTPTCLPEPRPVD